MIVHDQTSKPLQPLQPHLILSPLADTVVFKAVPAERTTAGLYLAESGATAEGRMKAIVVACGPGRMRPDGSLEPMPVASGDRIVLGMGAGPPGSVDVEGERFYFCRAGDIAATIVQGF